MLIARELRIQHQHEGNRQEVVTCNVPECLIMLGAVTHLVTKAFIASRESSGQRSLDDDLALQSHENDRKLSAAQGLHDQGGITYLRHGPAGVKPLSVGT